MKRVKRYRKTKKLNLVPAFRWATLPRSGFFILDYGFFLFFHIDKIKQFFKVHYKTYLIL